MSGALPEIKQSPFARVLRECAECCPMNRACVMAASAAKGKGRRRKSGEAQKKNGP